MTLPTICDSRGTPGSRDEYRARVQHCFEQALGRCPLQEVTLAIARRTLRLLFAGPALVPSVTRALAHLRADGMAEPAASELMVRLWDQASTKTGAPDFIWPGRLNLRGDVLHGWSGVTLAYSIDTGVVHYFDPVANAAALWVRDPDLMKPWQRAAPLRGLMSAWAHALGGVLVHGAVVGQSGRGVLLTAPSGGGKSTTTLACVSGGATTLGDDFVLVEPGQQPVMAHSLYSTAKLTEHALRTFPSLGRQFPRLRDAERDDGKSILWLAETHPDRLRRSLPLSAIVVPNVGAGRQVSVRPISKTRVLKELIPSSVLMLPGTGPETFSRLSALLGHLPTYQVDLGPNLAENAAAVLALTRPTTSAPGAKQVRCHWSASSSSCSTRDRS